MTDKVNVVLVHGAFADDSHWRHIIPELLAAGHQVMAAQNPLTSLADDIANTRKLAEWIGGPTLLVGHSYGGAVITGAGRATNVVGLVYIAAFAPALGESLNSILASIRRRASRKSEPIRTAWCVRRSSARTGEPSGPVVMSAHVNTSSRKSGGSANSANASDNPRSRASNTAPVW